MLYLTLRQIEYVTAIARAGSLSAAAAQLNVSQPSLSVALSQVEARLGQRLFIRRRGTPVTPTAFAESYLAEAEALLARARRLEDPEAVRRSLAGTLALGVFEDLAPMYLAPLLRVLRDTLPDVDLRWQVAGFETLARTMAEGRLDLALTYDLGLDAGFARAPLALAVPHAFVAADDPLATRHSLHLADLAGRALILFEEGLSIRHMLALFDRIGARPLVRHRVRALEVMRSLAAHGEGVGLSYTNPPGAGSYDGARLRTIAIADTIAAEPLILARYNALPQTAPALAAETAIARHFVALPAPEPASDR
ncbi:MAG: LysR family transcriptional regulator [Pararhodobacter sp.]